MDSDLFRYVGLFFTFVTFVAILGEAIAYALFCRNEKQKQIKKIQKEILQDEINQYMQETFSKRKFNIYKRTLDLQGKINYVVYSETYSWFEPTKYEWYLVYFEDGRYLKKEIEEPNR